MQFSFTDFVSVVKFSSDAEILGDQPRLARADANNIARLKQAISDSLTTGGETNFEAGLTRVFDLFDEAMNDAGNSDLSYTSHCEKVVLFLTAGERTMGGDPHSLLATRQQKLENHVNCVGGAKCRASIFTFTMGTGISTSAERDMHRIACSNRGVWSSIKDGKDPFNSMSSFYKVFLTVLFLRCSSEHAKLV
jgi:hypothetical protein